MIERASEEDTYIQCGEGGEGDNQRGRTGSKIVQVRNSGSRENEDVRESLKY